MSLEQNLLSEFAKAVNGNKSEQKSTDKFVRGTAKTIGGKKYVQLDGSNVTTPISETVDVEDGDRVLVSIENHRATILGNFTFPPSARKEQEAIDKAEDAQNGSNLASQKAEEAIGKATQADEKASSASAQAEEAIQKSQEALTHADEANKNVSEAKTKAEQAVQDAASAKESAAKAQADVANANAEIEKINGEITSVQGDIDGALEQLYSQAGEISSIKETYSTKVETDKVKADLTTEISKKVGELQTTVEQNYAAKTDIVEMEGKLQTQITQNAQGLSSQASKVEKLESDTAQAQQDVNKALQNAANAQNAADQAQANATAAQSAADKAKEDAANAKKAADDAEDLALKAAIDARVADEALTAAKTALDEAKKNYDLIVSNPESTQEQIQQAQNAVDTATANVNKALADAATAAYAADQAQKAADQAVIDANTAKNTANDAQAKADSATILANNAQNAADKAQQEVAELTKRVTTAETNITQNAEAIELNANKTTEIGDNLKNNYYSKTETDAKIKVESDRISSTVTKVETVEKNAVTGSVEEFYLSTSPTTLSGGSWSKTQPTWVQGKYIWRRTLVTKGDGTTSYSPSQNGVCITGNTGAMGSTGPAGKGVKSTAVTYVASTSGTTIPTSGWVTSIPSVSAGSYLWTRTVITYTDNSTSTSYSVGKMGSNGTPGPAGTPGKDGVAGTPGKDGKGVKSTAVTYQAAANGTTIPTGTWSTSIPKTTPDKPYLWTRTVITYTDNSTSTSYSVGSTPEGITVGGRNYIKNGKGDVKAGFFTNSTTIENGYGEFKIVDFPYTNASFTYKNFDISPGYLIPTREYTPGDIYTMSCDFIYTEFTSTTPVVISDYWFGQRYNAHKDSSVVDPSEWRGVTQVFLPKPSQSNVGKWQRIEIAIKIPEPAIDGVGDDTRIQIGIKGESASGTLTFGIGFKNVKLEKGNKATDWTPAPEDLVSNEEFDDTISGLDTSITETKSSIEQLADQITHLIVDENGSSMMTQDENGWHFDMSSITGNIDAVKKELEGVMTDHANTEELVNGIKSTVDNVNKKTAYININSDSAGKPVMTLGSSESSFKVVITNESIDFMNGTTKVAYASGNRFYAPQMVTVNSMQIGENPGFRWERRANGNLGLVYVTN